MRPTVSRMARRKGMSLLELIVSTAIFFLSLVAIYSLLDISQRSGIRARQRGQALRVCQARLAELTAGVLPLESANGNDEQAADYQWQISIENQSDAGGTLVKATVVAFHANEPRDSRVSLTQILLDPSFVGSLMDAVPDPALASAMEEPTDASSGSSGTSAGSSSTGGSGGSGGGGSSGGSSSRSSGASGGSSRGTSSSTTGRGGSSASGSTGSSGGSGSGAATGGSGSTGRGTSSGGTSPASGGSTGGGSSGGSRGGAAGGGR